MREYISYPGETVGKATRMMAAIAKESGEPVFCRFNGIPLYATPDSDPTAIADVYVLAVAACERAAQLPSREQIAEAIALCRRYDTPAVNEGAHALARKVRRILGDAE